MDDMNQTHHDCVTSERIALIVVGIITTCLGALVMLLRVYVCSDQKRKSGFDDIFMWIAWVFSIGFTIVAFISVRWGVGCKMTDLSRDWATNAVMYVYIVEIFYYLSVFFIKLSITCLYLRLAAGLRTWFWKVTVASIVVLVLQFTSTIIVTALQCRPIDKYWDLMIPGYCININVFFYSTNIFTVVSDCFILILPLPVLWSIQRPKKEKMALIATFLLGFVSTVFAGIRLYSIRIYTQSAEGPQDAAPITTWSFLEIHLGILCASGPALKSLIRRRKPALGDQHDGGIEAHVASLVKPEAKTPGMILTPSSSNSSIGRAESYVAETKTYEDV